MGMRLAEATNKDKPKHTPGPWRLEKLDSSTSIYGPDNKLVIAGEYDGWMVPFQCREEGLANAMLCATAPELLEACENAVEFLNNALHEFNDRTFIEKMELAIKRAKGDLKND